MTKHTAAYGTWESPVSADLVAASRIGIGPTASDSTGLYWTEMRPAEGGRTALVRRRPDGEIEDVVGPEFHVRTRVHEYGGGAFAVDEGTVIFSNFPDQRLFRMTPGGKPEPITPELPLRYADGRFDRSRELFYCVREDHRGEGEAVNTLVTVDLNEGDEGRVLAEGYDFYAAPRVSPDGAHLAWLCWNHPNMPWDGTELWCADLTADGTPENPRLVAGGESESVVQPEWSPEGDLWFVSDRTGWWNLYRERGGDIHALCPMEAEFAGPMWGLSPCTYDFLPEGWVICTYLRDGSARIEVLDPESGATEPLPLPWSVVGDVRAHGDRIALRVGSPTEPMALVTLHLRSGDIDVVRRSTSISVDPEYLSVPEEIEFPTGDGKTARAFYYPPRNPGFEAPAGEKPPLLVKSHGGPTAHATPELEFAVQFWTSRGIGVVDVNYGGSTGYGRAYRDRLKGHWGIVDVEDCINAARHLVEIGEADPERMAIRGGSAGGYTTLEALCTSDVFRAGASYFGVSDLTALARDTHKFESRYLDSLVGPWPEAEETYRERSPIHHADGLSCPVIFLQGLEDKVVPPSQAEAMVDVLREKGVPVAYLPFEGEQHGFRKQENQVRALESELYFYGRVFGFEPADDLPPVEIENL